MQAARPENYRPRAIDRRIDQLLRSFGAVEIAGPKWCGKTWTSLAHANSADSLTDPATLRAAQTSPDLVLSGKHPHLIDEWQEVPQIWDMVRSSPVEWCNRFVSFGLGYALSWSGGSSCPVGWGVSRDLVRMSRLR